MLDLDQRAVDVLRTIVHLYLQTRAPLGSQTLARQLEWSPATLRAVMADLEDKGYLYAMHRSGGRLPTTKGLRMAIQDMAMHARADDQDLRSASTVLLQACCKGAMGISQTLADLCEGAGVFLTVRQPFNSMSADHDKVSVAVKGHSHLLNHVHTLDQVHKIQRLFALLDHHQAIVSLFQRVIERRQVQILFGAEEGDLGGADCSVVAAPYHTHLFQGVVAVFGPFYMDYPRIIPIIGTMAKIVERTMK